MRRIVLVTLALLTLGAGKPKRAPEPPPPPPAAEELTAQVIETLTLETTWTVREPGAEPRAVLGYRLVPGTVTTTEVATTMTLQVSVTGPDGKVMEVPAPPTPSFTMRQRSTVSAPAADGSLAVAIEQVPGGSGVGAPGMDTLAGMVTTVRVDPAGRPMALEVTIPPGVDSAVAAALRAVGEQSADALDVFPRAPVGVGATWTRTIQMGIAGMNLVVDQTFTLNSLTADRAEVDMKMVMHRGEGAFAFPGVPAEAKVDLRHFEASGGGLVQVDLTRMVTTGTVAISLDMEMAASGIGAPGDAPVGIAMKLHQSSATSVVP